MYTLDCIDLACHGYIVFAPYHLGGSCQYNVDSEGKVTMYDSEPAFLDLEVRAKQLKAREQDFFNIFDEISSGQSLIKLNLGNKVKIDMSQLVTSGHSFGGVTAIRAAFLDKRVKAIACLDPWLWVHSQDIDQGKMNIETPMCAVNTENFLTQFE